jgi:preprotein translocase subunit SecA
MEFIRLMTLRMAKGPEDIYDHYLDEHHNLLMETKSSLSSIQPFECIPPDKSLTKIGRNEKCPCGSGKKYKKCCMKTMNTIKTRPRSPFDID